VSLLAGIIMVAVLVHLGSGLASQGADLFDATMLTADGRSLPANQISVHDQTLADTQFLHLINRDYPIGGAPSSEQIVSAWPTVPTAAEDMTINVTTLEAVRLLFAMAGNEGAGSLFLSSGYRTWADQSQIFEETADKSLVQPPGHSEHQTGLAADIASPDAGSDGWANSHQAQWLADNAWRAGLILRYPEDKQRITGIAHEPWHFRYVGQPHAWYCWSHGLSLEEYIQSLKDSGGYSTSIDGVNYTVLYQQPKDDMILVPRDLQHNISGDNTGGYIVTAWE